MSTIERISELISEREARERAERLAAEQEAARRAEAKKHAPKMWKQLRQEFERLCATFPKTLRFTAEGESAFVVIHTPDKRKVRFDFKDGRLYPDDLSLKGIPRQYDYLGVGPLPCHIQPNGELGFGHSGRPFWTPVALAGAVVVMLVSGAHHIEEPF